MNGAWRMLVSASTSALSKVSIAQRPLAIMYCIGHNASLSQRALLSARLEGVSNTSLSRRRPP